MNVAKEYKRGGFFGNSQEKFSGMEGAGGGINMAYANRGLLKTKGAALRREKRYLKKLAEQGRLGTMGPQSQDRLDYLRNVQKDRAKKGVAAGALAAAAAFGGPALLGALKSGGLSGVAGKGTGKALFKGASKAIGNIQKGKEILDSITPEQEDQIMSGDFYDDPSMNPYMMGGKMKILKAGGGYGKYGMKIPEGADVRSLLASLDNFTEEKDERRREEMKQAAPGLSDKEMNLKVLAALLERYKYSTPSAMGPKATDRYYSKR